MQSVCFFHICDNPKIVPDSVLAPVAGLAYSMLGLPLAPVAATTSASLSFLKRYLARNQVQALTRHHLLWQSVEYAISEGG